MMRFQSPLLILFSLLLSTKSQDFPVGSCGDEAGGAVCAPGLCCSIWGWCGNTPDYCDPQNCQSQCPPPPSPSPPPPSPPPPSPPPPSPPPPPPPPSSPPPSPIINCGVNHGGALCPQGMCCIYIGGFCFDKTFGLCYTTNCESQCPVPPICGVDAGGALCPPDECCTIAGMCASTTTNIMCNNPHTCQSGCTFAPGISMLKAIA